MNSGLVIARRGLLDALEALSDHREALILVGAQAVYLWTSDHDLGMAPMTLDADIAVDATLLGTDPRLEVAMEAAGFVPLAQPGMWESRSGIPVDLLVAEEQAQGKGKRAGRLEGHRPNVTRRVVGLESALVDKEMLLIQALESSDSREFESHVAGPAALLLAKAYKVAERVGQSGRRLDAAKKDTLDTLRILRARSTEDLLSRIQKLLDSDGARESATRGLDHLQELYGASRSPGLRLLRGYSPEDGLGGEWAASARELVNELMEGLGRN